MLGRAPQANDLVIGSGRAAASRGRTIRSATSCSTTSPTLPTSTGEVAGDLVPSIVHRLVRVRVRLQGGRTLGADRGSAGDADGPARGRGQLRLARRRCRGGLRPHRRRELRVVRAGPRQWPADLDAPAVRDTRPPAQPSPRRDAETGRGSPLPELDDAPAQRPLCPATAGSPPSCCQHSSAQCTTTATYRRCCASSCSMPSSRPSTCSSTATGASGDCSSPCCSSTGDCCRVPCSARLLTTGGLEGAPCPGGERRASAPGRPQKEPPSALWRVPRRAARGDGARGVECSRRRDCRRTRHLAPSSGVSGSIGP